MLFLLRLVADGGEGRCRWLDAGNSWIEVHQVLLLPSIIILPAATKRDRATAACYCIIVNIALLRGGHFYGRGVDDDMGGLLMALHVGAERGVADQRAGC
jgi:hypothetical protein